ncbi:MAG: transglutaminase-like domain-containing protein [Nanoarchaeota archaeon]|nr:transglutaminase-like domain-containing protein [Nanoarchaeota archaeon]
MNEEDTYEEDKKRPLKVIGSIALIFLIVVMIFPHYGIKHNPEPKIIIDYSLSEDISQGEFDGLYDVYAYPVSPDIKRAANKIVAEGCNSGIKICQIKAIHYFIRDKIDYVSDPKSREFIQTPESTLFSKAGDCEDKSVLLVSMLKAIGVNSEIMVKPGHAYNRIFYPEAPKKYLNDGWIYVDSTCSSCKFGNLE